MQKPSVALLSAVLLLQHLWLTTAQTCSASSVNSAADPQAARVQQAAGLLASGLAKRDLPIRRPLQPWPYKAVSTAALTGPSVSSNGVTYAGVKHQVLNGVSTAMMVWWFNQNLERRTTYKGDGKNYTLYLQWHPRDHCHQITVKRAPGPGASGDTWRLQEFLMASKDFTRSSSAGFNASSEAQINIELRVKYLNSTGISIQYQLSPVGPALSQVTHRWKNTASRAGLELVSEYQIGSESLSPVLNRIVNCEASRGEEPLLVASKWQQHCVEEMGNLQRILPNLYRRRNEL